MVQSGCYRSCKVDAIEDAKYIDKDGVAERDTISIIVPPCEHTHPPCDNYTGAIVPAQNFFLFSRFNKGFLICSYILCLPICMMITQKCALIFGLHKIVGICIIVRGQSNFRFAEYMISNCSAHALAASTEFVIPDL